jgi:D-3-phosphoglycerate dehydrogenase
MNHVLITDYVHPVLITGLRERGYFPHYAPEIERKEVIEWLPRCVGLVINTKTVADAEMIAAAPDLKWIGRLGSGLDIIDLQATKQRNIQVINTPQANANAVAEHAIGMLLSLLRNIPRADREVRTGLWNREKNRGVELKGKTIGIIGYGNTGSAFASKFAGWDVQVIAYDKYKQSYAQDRSYVKESSFDQVLALSDVISIHLPLTPETRHMVNGEFLSRCRHGVILVNTSRGRIVDTSALLSALRSGQVAGACLDVFENEKPETYSSREQEMYGILAEMENVILTPHIAGWTVESKRQISEHLLELTPSPTPGRGRLSLPKREGSPE